MTYLVIIGLLCLAYRGLQGLDQMHSLLVQDMADRIIEKHRDQR